MWCVAASQLSCHSAWLSDSFFFSEHLVAMSQGSKVSHPCSYPFQQNNNLLYLTGIDEPDAILVMQKDLMGRVKTIAFVQENDQHSMLWSGPLCGVAKAKSHFGLDLVDFRVGLGILKF